MGIHISLYRDVGLPEFEQLSHPDEWDYVRQNYDKAFAYEYYRNKAWTHVWRYPEIIDVSLRATTKKREYHYPDFCCKFDEQGMMEVRKWIDTMKNKEEWDVDDETGEPYPFDEARYELLYRLLEEGCWLEISG